MKRQKISQISTMKTLVIIFATLNILLLMCMGQKLLACQGLLCRQIICPVGFSKITLPNTCCPNCIPDFPESNCTDPCPRIACTSGTLFTPPGSCCPICINLCLNVLCPDVICSTRIKRYVGCCPVC